MINFSITFFLLSGFLCTMLPKIVDKIYGPLFSLHSSRTLKDIVHHYFYLDFPHIYNYISDIMVFFQIFVTLCVLPYDFYTEFFLIMAISQFLKFFCSLVTILPPLKKYKEKHRLWGINGNGVEYIFSGHAAYSSLTFIYLRNYIPIFPLVCYNFFSQFMIVASRNHYTVDVLLAWIIIPLLYSNEYLRMYLKK